MAYLNKQGIANGIHYPIALPFLKAYEHLGLKKVDFPVAHQYQTEIMSLPIFPEMTPDEHEQIIQAIISFFD